MNNDILAGNWKQMKGKVKEQWGKLTDDDLDVAEGRRDQILGKIQERYGIAKDEAERQLKAFEDQHSNVTSPRSYIEEGQSSLHCPSLSDVWIC